MSAFARVFEPLPQRMRNCRLVVRPSGTEPLIREMVEAATEGLLTQVLDQEADTIERYA